ncbi:MAG: 30S ribosomal protein S15 [Nanoarchaeota archaeon]|nr:30S ribosomal protein S15 [Nanoarchaeota archaeon]
MARMHSRKKGTSGSKFPVLKKVPGWMRYTAKEVELLIVKLAKEDHSTSEIGMILRDTYGVPNVKSLCNKSITPILKQKKLQPKLPEDLTNLIKKFIEIAKHQEANKKDMTAKRGRRLTISKIARLVKYYKKAGTLPQEWKFDPKQASMYVE